jgi:hypothetical protein
MAATPTIDRDSEALIPKTYRLRYRCVWTFEFYREGSSEMRSTSQIYGPYRHARRHALRDAEERACNFVKVAAWRKV